MEAVDDTSPPKYVPSNETNVAPAIAMETALEAFPASNVNDNDDEEPDIVNSDTEKYAEVGNNNETAVTQIGGDKMEKIDGDDEHSPGYAELDDSGAEDDRGGGDDELKMIKALKSVAKLENFFRVREKQMD